MQSGVREGNKNMVPTAAKTANFRLVPGPVLCGCCCGAASSGGRASPSGTESWCWEHDVPGAQQAVPLKGHGIKPLPVML